MLSLVSAMFCSIFSYITNSLADPHANFFVVILLDNLLGSDHKHTSLVSLKSSNYFRMFCLPSPLNVCSESSTSLNVNGLFIMVGFVSGSSRLVVTIIFALFTVVNGSSMDPLCCRSNASLTRCCRMVLSRNFQI